VSTRDRWPSTLALPDRYPLQRRSLHALHSPVPQTDSLKNRIPVQSLHLCRPSQESAIDNRNPPNYGPLAGSNAGLVPLNHRRAIQKRERPATFGWTCSSGADPNRPPEMCRPQRVGRTDRFARQFCAFPPSLNHSHLNLQNIWESECVNRDDENLRFQTVWNG
jgi:hypothetical protein